MQKFIITSRGELRMGDVNMHRNLLLPGDHCLGGGYWSIDYVSLTVVLSGMSQDYGEPQWGRVDVLWVPSGYSGMRFVYESAHGGTLDLTAQKDIKYY